MKLRIALINALTGVLFLSSCSAHRFFYYPTRYLYVDPASRGISYDSLDIPSLNGKNLKAIYFKSDTPPLGTVVHFHGNFGNISNHFMGSQFLTEYGYDVLVFDYQGYGGSDGKTTPKNTVEDGLAVVRYAQKNLRHGAKGVVVLGQSLGAAVGTVVAAKEPLVKAIVLEAPFYGYRSIARAKLGQHVITWLFYPIFPLFLGTTYDPSKFVADISPRPVFMIHGDQDSVIPVEMSKKLFKKAREPKKLWIIEGADHLWCRRLKGKEYERAIADFFSAELQK